MTETDSSKQEQRTPPPSLSESHQLSDSNHIQAPSASTQTRNHIRNFSREEHVVTRDPVRLDKLPEDVDDFGSPTAKINKGQKAVTDEGSQAGNHAVVTEEHNIGGAFPNGSLAHRRRSRSAGGSKERSRSTSAMRGRIRSEAINEYDDGQSQTVKSRDESDIVSERMATERESSSMQSRPGSRSPSKPRTDGALKARPESVTSAADQQRSRAETMSKVTENIGKRASGGVSEWSHQALAPKKEELIEEKEEEWQAMPALGEYDIYDDDGRLVAKGTQDSGDEGDHGGASKGYTRVQIDDDAKSATSMDENTNYLFKEKGSNLMEEEEEQLRDPLAQMQATKDMLTEGQRIAYVGVARLAMIQLLNELNDFSSENKQVKKDVASALESMKMWSQKMMVRLYGHMDIDAAEQVMIEQLADHGVRTSDLTPALIQTARVKNPMADLDSGLQEHKDISEDNHSAYTTPKESNSPVKASSDNTSPKVRSPTQLPPTETIDIDLRWTVLCDLFLVLIADSIYDSRSRKLLEIVGDGLDVKWIDICRFEKRVTDALEMQEEAARENWDEAEHMETRRKNALNRKYIYMGLATVGGSLIIGLSAGLLAPVIGAGLAAGFTTIGVAGTSGFLAGVGGTALITTIGVTTGGTIAIKASGRRMGAVKTFEYRPLHNNKRVNLIVTVAGWMNGKVDDVRLPFSTVDPIMGDIYSVHWEPDMLQSIGDTVRILATEALTSGLQQVLAATILTTLMAALALPVWLAKLSYLVDNPWSVSMDRADAAGLILADSLREKNLGARPITLVGFSIGARVIFACLKELAEKGAHGIIQNVYLFGSPVVAKVDDYNRARTMVAGRFVNAYATNDWILGYLFRATKGGISRVAGLKAVENVPGLENLDVTELVQGHMAYRAAMPRLLRHVGWEVESDEFDEIIDPDPENHESRQRELIKEIEDARKEAEQPEKKRFGFFKRGKPADKKNWETYDEKMGTEKGEANGSFERKNSRVLFDIEAIKRELASEAIEVKQLESTLPPMQIDLSSPRSTTDAPSSLSPRQGSVTSFKRTSPRTSKSYDATDLSFTDGGTTTAARPERSPSLIQRMLSSQPQSPASPPPVRQDTLAPVNPSGSPIPRMTDQSWHQTTSRNPSPQPSRPELNKVQTMPLEKNAWHDEAGDDEEEADWDRERHVVMSFE